MAGGGTEVARAYVTIIPKSDGTSDSVVRSVVDPLAKGGNDAGKKAGEGFAGAFGPGIAKAGKLLGALGLGVGVASFVKDSISAGMDFDKAMSQVAATMGTTTDQIGDLRDFAKEMGASTAFSATQAAEALNYMALAGYDAETSMSMLPNVLNLAAAGSMDLAQASDMITDTQSALGLSLEETTELVDKMAAASSKTNTSVSQLGSALLTVGGTAKNLSGGTTEASQALGLLADNGIKGAEGGTALRNVLLGLSSDKFAKTFGEMGVAVYDTEGNMRSLKDIFMDMNDAMEGMTVEEKTEAISSAFNKVDLKSVNALLGTNAERWDEVAAAIDDSQGAAQAMADTQLDNLAGDVTIFQSALEGLQIAVSDALTPALRGFVQLGTDGLGALSEAMGTVQAFLDSVSAGFSSAFDSEGAQAALAALSEALAAVFGDDIQIDVQAFGNAVGNAVAGIVNATVPVIEWVTANVVPVIQNVHDTVLPIVQEIALFVAEYSMQVYDAMGEAFGAIGDLVQDVWPSISETVSSVMEVVKTVVPPVWNAIKTNLTTSMNAIRGIVQTVWPAISGIVTNAANTIKNVISGISSVVGTVQGIFNRVKSAIADPINTAKQLISDAIDKIKSIFSGLKLELPSIKLPHFSVSGGEAPYGIGGKGSLPKFSVDWYAKGGIVDGASLIGVGERGAELVWPSYDPYISRYAEAIADAMPASGGITVNLNYTNDADAAAMARDVAWEIRRYELAGAF